MADDAQDPATATATATALPPVALFKQRKGKVNIRKRPATPPLDNASSNDDSGVFSEDDTDDDDDGGGLELRDAKRRKKNAASSAVFASSSSKATTAANPASIMGATIYQTDRERDLALSTTRDDATRSTTWFEDDEGIPLSEARLLGARRKLPSPDGTYRGLRNQTSFVERNPDAPNRSVGPVRAPTNIRTITITDMAADVCKDYKKTGFCGFGDNCKFLHAREDYAAGWQLDREWDTVTKGKKVIGGTVVSSADRKQKKDENDADADADEAEQALLENIPFACIICEGPYKSPVVTRCGHYFCEACALKRYRKDPGCAACGAGTNGVFNSAKRLQNLLDKKKARLARKRQEAIEAGEEVSGSEGDDDDGDES